MVDIHLFNGLEQREELLSLYQTAFDHGMSEALWNWKYVKNPASGPRPEVIVAMDNGQIVGARHIWPMELWLKDSRIRVAQMCDGMMHPHYQRKGLFKRIRQYDKDYINNSEYMLQLNTPSEYMLATASRIGGKALFELDSLFKVQNLDRLLTCRFNNNRIINVLGFLYRKVPSIKSKKTLLPQKFQAHVIDKYTDELGKVDSLRDTSKINLVRDEPYLKWRFDHHPEHKYKYVIVKQGDELWGYAVISAKQSSDGLIQGMIVDYLIKNNDINCFRVLVNQCLNELCKLNCDLISIGPHTEESFRRELLKNFGFHSSIRFPYSIFRSGIKNYFHVFNACSQLSTKLEPYVYNKHNWYFIHAYVDNT
jgi:hypothetical protein